MTQSLKIRLLLYVFVFLSLSLFPCATANKHSLFGCKSISTQHYRYHFTLSIQIQIQIQINIVSIYFVSVYLFGNLFNLVCFVQFPAPLAYAFFALSLCVCACSNKSLSKLHKSAFATFANEFYRKSTTNTNNRRSAVRSPDV